MWIQNIDPRDAQGRVKRVYEAAIQRVGKVYQIVRAMSLAPATMEASLDLYLRVMHSAGSLSRRRRELLAVVVSRANECHY